MITIARGTLWILPPDNWYITSYNPLMIQPKNFAIGPKILPGYAVNSMADIKTSILV
jgi:hypothetical protein